MTIKTPQLKSIAVLAAAVLGVCVCSFAADHDYYGSLHYPKELVPGVGRDMVQQEGGPNAVGYHRRTIQWWPRQGQDIVEPSTGDGPNIFTLENWERPWAYTVPATKKKGLNCLFYGHNSSPRWLRRSGPLRKRRASPTTRRPPL